MLAKLAAVGLALVLIAFLLGRLFLVTSLDRDELAQYAYSMYAQLGHTSSSSYASGCIIYHADGRHQGRKECVMQDPQGVYMSIWRF